MFANSHSDYDSGLLVSLLAIPINKYLLELSKAIYKGLLQYPDLSIDIIYIGVLVIAFYIVLRKKHDAY